MAGAKKHAVFTFGWLALYAGLSLLTIGLSLKHGYLIGAGIIFTGILIDIDHLSKQRLIGLVKKGKLIPQVEGWTNHFHTWYGAIIILAASLVITRSLWAFGAYLLHIFIDACNEANEVVPLESPLSEWLYRKVMKKYFRFFLYNYNPSNQQPPSK